MIADLENLRRKTRAAVCLECGKCSTLCPLAGHDGFSAARMIAIRDPEEGIRGRAGAVDRCLTCGSCEVRCPQGVRFTEFVKEIRPHLPQATRHPCPHGEALNAVSRMMAEPEAPRRDLSWVGDDLGIAQEGKVALFVGCLPFFDAYFGSDLGVEMLDIARSAIRLLNRLHVEPVLLEEERCCGHDQLWSGDRETFTSLARANAAAFEERGIEHILTTCAECCRTWRIDYQQAVPGYRPRVEHLSEYLARHIEGGEELFHRDGDAAVTFQDPCRLGRHLEVFEAPRRVLGAMPGAKVVEMARSGRDAVCCGTTGFVQCDATSRHLQAERLRAAASTGAAKLLTACPKCLIHFSCAQNEDGRREQAQAAIEIQDLTVWAAAGLGDPREAAE